MSFLFRQTALPSKDEALPGHEQRPFPVPERHEVLGTPLEGQPPDGFEVTVFGTGCFWGTEELFWRTPGVWSTAVGYAGGVTPHPTYEEVCSGLTGHTEAVRIVYDPSTITYATLLKLFWESHDPTQGYRQGNDRGTQYRSAIYYTSAEQRDLAERTREAYAPVLASKGYGEITTEIAPLDEFYLAEDYHQQYLFENPGGYRCHSATGVALPA